MNNRRKLIVTLGVSALAAPFASFAQQQGKPARVGILVSTTAAKYQKQERIFVESLRESGWIEGNNVVYDRAYADDNDTQLPLLAEGLVKRNSTLIWAPYNPTTRVAFAKTHTIPIVCSSVSNPIENGFVKSLAHPGGNVTGVTNIGYELGGKRMQLVMQMLPNVSRVGVLTYPVGNDSSRELKLIEQSAASSHVKIIPVQTKDIGEIETAITFLSKSRAEALLVTHRALFITKSRKQILTFAANYRIPVIGPRSEFTDEGGLMSYGANLDDHIRRAAQMADKILRGAKPADIPMEQPTRFDLVVNKITAKALGIKIPNSILVQATKVIE